MRGVEAVQGVDGDAQGHRHAERPVMGLEEATHGDAVDVAHHQEELVVLGDQIDDLRDVRVVDPCGEARLVDEHRPEVCGLRQVRVHALDRDDAGEALRADDPAEVHTRHAARRDPRAQFVAADPSA